MAVVTGEDARAGLRALLDQGHADRPFAEQPVEAPLSREVPRGWLWSTGTPRPGLRVPAAYTETLHADPGLRALVHLSPAEALAPAAAPRTNGSSGPDEQRAAAQEAYLRSSIDVTMKGGTTSGVIYPLALCEIARDFRLRNVGGASAGAIAASFAAAAEVGRATEELGRGTEPDGPPATSPAEPDLAHGRVHRGFVGLADVIAWLTQLDSPDTAAEEFRTAQLFKPKRATLPIFRAAAAIMRRRYWALPLLAATSFLSWMRDVCLAFLLVLPALLYGAVRLVEGTPPQSPLVTYLVAAGWLTGLSLAVFGVVVSYATLRRPSTRELPPELAAPVPVQPPPPTSRYAALLIGTTLVGLGSVLVIPVLSESWRWLGLGRSVLAWLAGVVVVLGCVVVSILRLLDGAKSQGFGLVGGSSVTADGTTDLRYLHGPLARLMGMPPVTVDVNLVDWLNRCLSDLAGTSEVLRFGHLWHARYTSVPGERDATLVAELELAADEPDHRMVNLELMASELVHRVPYRFPLAAGSEQLYLLRSDMEGIFPPEVVAALTAGEPVVGCRDLDTGRPLDPLFPLPAPADLPVIVAVRISLAFPGLFEALHLYRRSAQAVVRDDFGAPVLRDGERLRYPGAPAAGAGAGGWVQELWFTDGGVTSNFPIHFFDSIIPRWPTVGINLGPHPRGFEHQDIYLPTDQEASSGVPATMGTSFVGFLSAVVDTARNWRDTAQTFLPASKGRIAWVRQRSYEGGSNLFMPRDRIAMLALRGAVAGARLRRRFAADAQWQRHQWLRLRVGLDNLASLHTRMRAALQDPQYAKFTGGELDGREALRAMVTGLADQADPTPAGADPYPPTLPGTDVAPAVATGDDPFEWFLPAEGPPFWTAASQLLGQYGTHGWPTGPLTQHAPTPAASLRQVPPN